ncbi:MAG: alpha/beta fold hydrolase [Planctomycetia bacterium]|nr:alpha/beta fold hydrolase [Planctomycetia bacterium]
MNLYYEEKGKGSLLLLIHGFPFDHRMWDDLRELLSETFRVVTPDLRGMGKSPLQESQNVVTMAELADDLAELLDRLGVGKCTFCGLSMGGYVGWEFWQRHSGYLEKLIFCDTNAAADTPEGAAQRYATAQRVESEKSVAFLADGMAGKLLAPRTLTEKPWVVERYRRMVEENSPQGVAAVARGMAQRHDFRSKLREVACPTLVLTGDSDVLSPPADMLALAESLPDGRFVEIPHAGHLTPMENPHAVAEAIRHFMQ